MRTLTRSCVPVLLVATTLLTACGGNAGTGDKIGRGLDSITVKGEFGTVPTVSWDGLEPYPNGTSVATRTVITGTGAAIPANYSVDVKIYISDAEALQQDQALCAQQSAAATPSASASCNTGWPVSGKAIDLVQTLNKTATVTLSNNDQSIFKDFFKDAHVGSRVVGLMGSKVLGGVTGQGADSVPTLGIGNNDAVLVIMDFVKLGAAPPKAVDVPAAQLPGLVLKDGKPTGFKTAGIKTPTRLERVILTEGTGATVTSSSNITAYYLGQAAGATKPFQGNYGGQPLPLNLAGGAIQGWTYGLDGVKVGSRVLLAIPAALAYGDKPPAGSGIPVNATLYFVLDVVSAS